MTADAATAGGPAGPAAAGDLQAVLFDMDGLLVSTEETWYAAESEVVAALSSGTVAWSPEHQKALVGGPLHVTTRHLLDVTGSAMPPRQAQELLVTVMERRLRTGPVRWMPGAVELLREVTAAGLPCALVSASFRRLVDAVLDAVRDDFAGFRTSVAGDEVPRTKPHPDPYLLAARRLGADPARCVVLEDSATGVAAALAAGCITVAVPSLVDLAPDPEPGRRLTVVRSLRELDLEALRMLVHRVTVAGPSVE